MEMCPLIHDKIDKYQNLRNHSIDCKSHLNNLRLEMNKLHASDINFKELHTNKYSLLPNSGKAVNFINIYEDEQISVSVFSLPSFSYLPLHDHPGMHGLIKVISGSILIKNLTILERDIKPEILQNLTSSPSLDTHFNIDKNLYIKLPLTKHLAKLESVLNISHLDEALLLSPLYHNLHEIRTSDSPGAFLDILFPPYNENLGRDCHYYNIQCKLPIKSDNKTSQYANYDENHFKDDRYKTSEIYILNETECPYDYRCKPQPYLEHSRTVLRMSPGSYSFHIL
ncbi:2-aminoethanethiol dioxygenase-like [Gordionus sp. m RMFG-2023]|uniref:2-aminoethanethiol dioxygenase-like n=1 Tax=Gordionus sp. m RMFG-2023 TaxID=3053472 RepID=UPI0031FE2517